MNEDNLLEWLEARLNDDDYATARAFLDDYMRGNREYRESSEARMSEYASAEEDYGKQIQDLKARNYDLLMQIPVAEEPGADGTVVEDVDDDGTVLHIDNLFTDPDEKEGK